MRLSAPRRNRSQAAEAAMGGGFSYNNAKAALDELRTTSRMLAAGSRHGRGGKAGADLEKDIVDVVPPVSRFWEAEGTWADINLYARVRHGRGPARLRRVDATLAVCRRHDMMMKTSAPLYTCAHCTHTQHPPAAHCNHQQPSPNVTRRGTTTT